MKLYNIVTDKIENKKTIHTKDGLKYPNKLTDERLNSYGYYRVKYESLPNRRYYDTTAVNSIINKEYSVGYISVDKSLDEVKSKLKQSVSERFKELSNRPRVDTGLGYLVDGSRVDLNNFEIGKKYNFPTIKDIDGNDHVANPGDYDTIVQAIEQYGIGLYQTKWLKEATIDSFTTVAECALYEATPYDYTVTEEDVANSLDGTLIAGTIITKYKNNTKEW